MNETTEEEIQSLHKRLVYFVRGHNYGSICKLKPNVILKLIFLLISTTKKRSI